MGERPKIDNPIASLGGKASAAKLSPAERGERAKQAAEARWTARLPKATHAGVLRLGNTEIQCAVLEDGRRLLTQETFLTAIGRSRRPKAGTGIIGKEGQRDKLPPFLAARNLKPFIGEDLANSATPITYRALQDKKGYGYIATLLPEVCRVYVSAANAKAVWKSQRHVADACRILHDPLAGVGIISLVDEATGYQYVRPRLGLQEFLAMYIGKELAAWAKTFPDEFYREVYRLKGWAAAESSTARIPAVGKIPNDLVYSRLAPLVLEELKRVTPKDDEGRRKHKVHQRRARDPGVRELKEHFRPLLAISRGYDQGDYPGFYRHVNRALPIQPQHPDLFSHTQEPPDAT